MTFVIVGNGVASVGAIEGIRKREQYGRIVVVGDEPILTYSRPLISYLLAGKVSLNQLILRPDNFYEINRVECKLGFPVTAVDPTARIVTTAAGEAIAYDKLLLATGGTPVWPFIEGLEEGKGIYSFTALAHAQALIDLCDTNIIKKAVVIGGGPIGLKVVEGLYHRGIHVEVVEIAPWVLSAAFDNVVGDLIAKRFADFGIGIHCNVAAKAILHNAAGNVIGIKLSDGRELAAEAVVIATGVVPNITLAKSAGLTVDCGILVNEYMQTSDSAIFAAGDVAESLDILTENERIVPNWPNAYSQGYYAGLNMAGPYQAFPGNLIMNASTFYGLPTISMGKVNPPTGSDYEVFTNLDQQTSTYRKLIFQGDKLIGYVLVGNIVQASVYTGFIRFQIPLTDDMRAQLEDGYHSPLLWPEKILDRYWNPREEDSSVV